MGKKGDTLAGSPFSFPDLECVRWSLFHSCITLARLATIGEVVSGALMEEEWGLLGRADEVTKVGKSSPD